MILTYGCNDTATVTERLLVVALQLSAVAPASLPLVV
jgi:hypothetical protein